MSEASPPYNEHDHREAVAQARAEIETAIATIRDNKSHITEGQAKAIKRILYGDPAP